MMNMVLVILGVGPISENGYIGLKNEIVLRCFREVKCHQGYPIGI